MKYFQKLQQKRNFFIFFLNFYISHNSDINNYKKKKKLSDNKFFNYLKKKINLLRRPVNPGVDGPNSEPNKNK